MELTTKEIGKIEEYKRYNAIIVYNDGSKEKSRIFREGLWIYQIPKRARKYGYMIDNNKIEKVIIKEEKSEKEKWEESLLKAKKMLEESGLWKDLLEKINIALEVGYEKIQEASDLYWRAKETDKKNKEDILAIDNRLYDTEILWNLSGVLKIEKMYFGKENNKRVLKEIKEAMENKNHYIYSGYNGSYDITFKYIPEKNIAYYSKEYKGMGNGHYYLALNSTHALWYEDD
jgi:hypothetical protein